MAVSLDQFVQQLNGSGLLSAEEVSTLRTECQPADAEQFARDLVKRKTLTAFQAQQLYSGKGKSLVLGNYVILDKLGQGGMGMVLKAEHRRMKRIVALKVLSPTIVKTKELLARFHREVQAAAKLEHPNVVASYDADEAGGTHFFVMQFVDGSDLASLVKKKGPLPIDKAVNCILQTAHGLEYAHKRGVIHRDIKPANLLLDGSGVVKILDMGLARIEGDTGSQAELTGTGAVMGTVDYMAPEQALSTKHADARSDIYSLGVSLWYLLTGRPVYDGDTLTARLLAHQNNPIPSLRSARSDVPAALDTVFRMMVAKQSSDRYQTMTEVIAALEACLRGETVAPSVSSAPSEDTKLREFLAGIVQPQTSPGTALREKSATAAEMTEDFSPTITSSAPEVTTDPQTLTSLVAAMPAAQPQPHTRRPQWWHDRWVQIGAMGGLIALLAAIVFLASDSQPRIPVDNNAGSGSGTTAGSSASADQKHRDALDWVLTSGGTLKVMVNGQEKTLDRRSRVPAEPFEVTDLDLTGAPKLKAAEMAQLSAVPGKFWLRMPRHLSEADQARAISKIPGATALVVGNVDPTLTRQFGDGLGQHPVAYLVLYDRILQPGSLAALRQLPRLESLLLHRCTFDREVLTEAMQLPHLKHLNIEGSTVDDAMLAALSLPQLQSLAVWATAATPQGLAAFQMRHPNCGLGGLMPGYDEQIRALGAQGAAEHALEFDGFDQHVAIRSLKYPGDSLTLEAWIERGPLSTMNYLATYDAQHNASLWGGTGINGFTVTTPQGTRGGKQDTPLETGRWSHVAGVFDGNMASYFVDGRLVHSSKRVLPAEPTGHEAATWIGGVPAVGFWRGKIREVRISKTARFDSTFTPQERFSTDSETLALYRFDEGSGDVLKDSSGNNHHGKIVGAKWVTAGKHELRVPELTLNPNSSLAGPLIADADGWYTLTPSEKGKNVPIDISPVWSRDVIVRARILREQVDPGNASLKLRSDKTRGAYLALIGGTNVAIVAHQYSDKVGTVLHTAPLPPPQVDGSYDVEFSAIGDRLEVRLNGKAACSVTDARYGHAGGVGLGSSITPAKFRDVAVRTLDSSQDPPVRYALDFDGEASYVHLPTLKQPGGPLTVEVRLKRRRSDFEVIAFGAGSLLSSLYLHPDKAGFFLAFPDSSLRTAGALSGSTDGLQHLAGVWDGQRLRCFLDGKLVSQEFGPDDYLSRPAFVESFLGAQRHESKPNEFATTFHFDGLIAEARYSKTARYLAEFTPPSHFETDADTLAMYRFDEGAGDVLKDSSGNNHHGKIIGAKWVPVVQPPPPGNYALEFDGVDDFVNAPLSGMTADDPLTAEAWVDLSQLSAPVNSGRRYSSLMLLRHTAQVDLSVRQDEQGGRIAVKRESSSPTYAQRSGIPEGRAHVAFVVSNGSVDLYVNGSRSQGVRTEGVVVPGLKPELWLGAMVDWKDGFVPAFFRGRMDEVRISKVARYSADFTPQERFDSDADTITLYHCDEGTGDVLMDSSGNSNHGKIGGAKWVRTDTTKAPAP